MKIDFKFSLGVLLIILVTGCSPDGAAYHEDVLRAKWHALLRSCRRSTMDSAHDRSSPETSDKERRTNRALLRI